MKHKKIFLLLFACCLVAATSLAQQKPNIIYILADDMGYGDLGCYGQKQIRTPNIDALATAGMLFTQHYAGAPVCSPSRAVLMTGRDVGHARIRGNYENGPFGFGAGLELRDSDITLGEILRERGYATAVIGKWGMGVETTSGEPGRQGFDYSYGFLNQGHAHYQFPEYLYRNGQRFDLPENKADGRRSYSNNLFTEEALNFVATHKNEPFFLYLAYTTPHAELLVPEDTIFASYRGRFEETPFVKNVQGGAKADNFGAYNSQAFPNAAYAACITHLDMSIGRIIALLKQQGLYENTLVIFSSDNGPSREGGANPAYFSSSGGLRGMKRDVYEGGIRVPMIAVWPGRIKGGASTDHISGFQDLMPTLADVSGQPLSQTIPTEGISFYPLLIGKKEKQLNHPYLYWEFHEGRTTTQALRRGDWKAVRQAPDAAIEIYNLARDRAEKNNLAAQQPALVKTFEALFKKARTDHELWPLKTTRGVPGKTAGGKKPIAEAGIGEN